MGDGIANFSQKHCVPNIHGSGRSSFTNITGHLEVAAYIQILRGLMVRVLTRADSSKIPVNQRATILTRTRLLSRPYICWFC